METKEILLKLCYDENGALKPLIKCRATIINQLILEDGMGVDAAEDLADKTLRETGFWPAPKFDFEEETNPSTSSGHPAAAG